MIILDKGTLSYNGKEIGVVGRVNLLPNTPMLEKSMLLPKKLYPPSIEIQGTIENFVLDTEEEYEIKIKGTYLGSPVEITIHKINLFGMFEFLTGDITIAYLEEP